MEEHEQIAENIHSQMVELAKKVHALGYALTGVTFRKHEGKAPVVNFGTCTTECGFDENGHYRCWTHCP